MFKIYTDGACKGNPGKGGWGAILIDGDVETVIKGFESNTTNNRMELLAVIEGLSAVVNSTAITLYSDSTYVVDGINKYLSGWVKRGWKNASGADPKNLDLWKRCQFQLVRHKVTAVWVKAHNGDPYNEQVDKIASNQCAYA